MESPTVDSESTILQQNNTELVNEKSPEKSFEEVKTKKNNKSKCCAQQKDGNDSMKLKILALHGYRQTGETFRQKTGSFRKIVHKYAQFTFITAPHKVIPLENTEAEADCLEEADNPDQYGWWFNRDDRSFRGIRKGGPAIGYEESIKLIEETFEKHGPFDGLLGFSQGACLVGLLCDLQARGLTKIKFDFAIMSSGFKSGSLPHLKYFSDPISLPTMHIYGENDNIIPKELSIELRKAFIDGEEFPITVTHAGGHFLPGTSIQKNQYIGFFKLRYLQKLHRKSDADNSEDNI